MQKLIYPVWKSDGLSTAEFREILIGTLSPKIIQNGSKQLRVCVVDDDVAAAAPYRIVSDGDPIDAVITIWLDTYLQRSNIEKRLPHM